MKREFLETDFAGRKLCRPCWDGNHYFKWANAIDVGHKGEMVKVVMKTGNGSGVFSNCQHGECTCKCRELRDERHPRPKKDTSSQISIMEVAGTITV